MGRKKYFVAYQLEAGQTKRGTAALITAFALLWSLGAVTAL